MFTAMHHDLALKHESEDANANVSSETVDILRQNIEMFLLQQYDEVYDNTSLDAYNKSESALKYSFQLLSVLDRHLDSLIDLNTKDNFNSISGRQYSSKTTDMKKLKQVQTPINKNILNKIHSLPCLFTWNLQPSPSKKDIISRIKKKYGNYNLDISLPVFTFERYISNIIIGYELFNNGNKETAIIVLLLIGKWLEELDKSTDEFYLLISDGLKYVLKSTFAHMIIKNMSEKIQWLLDSIIPFSDVSNSSKSAVDAIQAAVLIEYGNNEDCFKKAIECINIACDLDPTIPYWFYLHSLILTAQRHFLLTYKSCPTENEQRSIQQAILLSSVQNICFKYHEIKLFKDTVLYNFHKNKNKIMKNDFLNNKHLCKEKEIVLMIKKLVSLELTDPLIFINCVKILRTLSTLSRDLNFEKHLLIKGLQIAPNDLIVFKAVAAQVIIHCKKKIQNNRSFQYQDSIIKKQSYVGGDMKLAVGKHNLGEDPVLYLTSILNKYDCLVQWKILAQICSYTVLYNDNLNAGVKIFMMLVEAEENEIIHSDLILRHYSSFVFKPKKFNLAELISDEINIALNDDIDNHKEKYYRNVLKRIVSIYNIDINVNRSIRSYLIGEPRNRKSQLENDFRSYNNQSAVNHQFVRKLKTENYIENENQSIKKRNPRNNQNNDDWNLNSRSYDNLMADNIDQDDSTIVRDSDNDHNNNNCCLCRIM